MFLSHPDEVHGYSLSRRVVGPDDDHATILRGINRMLNRSGPLLET
jgi:hypothetical protein